MLKSTTDSTPTPHLQALVEEYNVTLSLILFY